MLVGLAPGVPKEGQFARRLAENGCRVLVPVLIDRKDDWSGNPKLGRMTNQPHREFIYRMAYEMGRHVIGYEVQKVLAAVDWFCQEKDHPPVGGRTATARAGCWLSTAGPSTSGSGSTVVSGYFGPREEVWQEPIYRNVWGLLREFGDAELAANLFDPLPGAVPGRMRIHRLFIENSLAPVVDGPPAPARPAGRGAAPGRLWQRPISEVEAERPRP